MNDIGILSDKQFGFRLHHSTSDQLLRVVKFTTKSTEWKQFTSAVFLNVAKTSDSVWHEELVYKIHFAGILLALVLLIDSFLNARTFRTRNTPIKSKFDIR